MTTATTKYPPTTYLSAEVYTVTSLYMQNVSLYNRRYINARRKFRFIEEELLQHEHPFIDWLGVNEENTDYILDRLRSKYQEEMFRASSGLVEFKQRARRFLKEVVSPEQADKSLRLFDVYCKAVDKKATLKPSRRRWSKTRSFWDILRMSLQAVI